MEKVKMFSVWFSKSYGLNIFVCCSDYDDNENPLFYELKTVKYQNKGVILSYDKKGGNFRQKDPYDCLVAPILKPNCFTKPNIKLEQVEKNGKTYFRHKIEVGTKLYNKIKEKGGLKSWEEPEKYLVFKKVGDYKDYNEINRTYWEETFAKKQEKNQKLDLN